MAYESQGVRLSWATTTVVSTNTEVVGVKGFSINGSNAVIDITGLGDTAKMKLAGVQDEGEISIDINWIATDTGQGKVNKCKRERIQGAFCIEMAPPSSVVRYQGQGFITGLNFSGSVDNAVTGTITIAINGKATWVLA